MEEEKREVGDADLKKPEITDADLDKAGVNFEGFSAKFAVLYKDFQELLPTLSKKQAFRLLEAIVAFPLEHEGVSLPAGSDKAMALIAEIYTVKQNMTLAYMMDASKAQMEEAVKKAEEAQCSGDVCEECIGDLED